MARFLHVHRRENRLERGRHPFALVGLEDVHVHRAVLEHVRQLAECCAGFIHRRAADQVADVHLVFREGESVGAVDVELLSAQLLRVVHGFALAKGDIREAVVGAGAGSLDGLIRSAVVEVEGFPVMERLQISGIGLDFDFAANAPAASGLPQSSGIRSSIITFPPEALPLDSWGVAP